MTDFERAILFSTAAIAVVGADFQGIFGWVMLVLAISHLAYSMYFLCRMLGWITNDT